MRKTTLFLSLAMIATTTVNAQKKVTFPSEDDLMITADIYHISDDKPVILLCHQAGFSRGEYVEIAVRLNKLGFNCVAIDLRSGQEVNGIINETAGRAVENKRATDYLDTEQDINAGIDYVYRIYKSDIILWGSSYSASLALKIAAENKKVKAVLAFSPGEYFGAKLILRKTIKDISKPVFVTSSKSEIERAAEVLLLIANKDKVTHFKPEGKGIHGSRALWDITGNNKEYWEAVETFLELEMVRN